MEDTSALRGGDGQDLRGVTVSLSVDKAVITAREDVTVTVTLHNSARHPVKLLKWYTPVEGVEEALFQVTRDGKPVPFMGPHYKRPAPREGDFIRLAPGESLTRTVELSGLYDLSQTGSYSIRYEVGTPQLHGASSNAVELWIEGRPSAQLQAAPGAVDALAGSVTFTGRCSSTQQSTLLEAVSAAGGMANDSVSYLSGTPSATPRYTTWFGAFSTSGWDTAKNHFVSIKDAIDNKPLTLDCSCKKNYYAYVYPSKPYIIYVCSAFWTAPMTGTDSKGGTLIHELSHFTVVAGTDDWAYGQSAAKQLAASDPAKALNNADNHEYFAENTPYQQ